MFRSFALFLFLAVTAPLMHCAKNSSAPAQAPPQHPATTKTLLSLGDSYTIGQSVNADQRFPAQAASLLKPLGIAIDSIQYLARTGWTTTDLMRSTEQLPDSAQYDFVTLLIGVNDQYQRRNIADYPANFTALLNKAIRYAGGKKDHVLVISIPDYSITPFVAQQDKAAVSAEIADYNTINHKITFANGCIYIDITDEYQAGAFDPSLIADDRLHPSGKEYLKWATRIADYISALK